MTIGFEPDEIDITESTRSARLKWAIVVNDTLPAGLAANAAVCCAAATAAGVRGLLGPDGADGGGTVHPGLPWAGCSVLKAPNAKLRDIRARATERPDMFVADMPEAAQTTRVYAEYLSALAQTDPEGISYFAVSIVGPRKAVDRVIGRLALL